MIMKSDVYVIGGIRTPFVRSFSDFRDLGTQELMQAALNGLVDRYGLQGAMLGDVAIGAVINSARNWNIARECVLGSKLSPNTPGYNVQRACGTSLETAFQLFAKIAMGFMDSGIAGGVDSNSAVPLEAKSGLRRAALRLRTAKSAVEKLRILAGLSRLEVGLEPPVIIEPQTGLSMGQHCEIMVKQWRISQNEQDELALRSHQNAASAYDQGFYSDLIVPVHGVSRDSFVRHDTSIEKLTKLRPAFDKSAGTITAGNASPLTDGSSCVLMGSREWAEQKGLRPGCRFIDVQVNAVDFVSGEGLLMAPTSAVAKPLKRNQMKLSDFDVYEIHEAFAGQVLCTLKAWESESYCREKLGCDSKLGSIDLAKLNPVGGSVALGHPFAATGGRILASLAKLLRGTEGRALISVCTAGGMGIAAIVEGAK